ncbi:Serine/threonine-protein kinase PrkC [Phycisphaerae bacterium RAS1]|nr:Serine/threonine-protein kinase PrkC [Phycisphaerae bacterium RAS1]
MSLAVDHTAPRHRDIAIARERLKMTSGSSQTRTSPGGGMLLDELLEQVRGGAAPDIDALIARYPEEADSIRQLIAVMQFIDGAADRLSPTAELVARFKAAAGPPVLGDFRILREVGRGGMGVVYEAVQVSLDRRVALKVLLPGVGFSSSAVERFHREARTAGALQHRHIVPVYAIGEHDGVPYYAMQFIDGVTLSTLVRLSREEGRTPDAEHFRRVGEWGRQVADALAYAHQQGVIHRDVKPSNLLVSPDGNVWVTDFGLARRDAHVSLTLTGDVIGTVRYMSPEQARGGAGPIDERSDVYALGVTLYELTCFRPPFDGPDRESTLRQVLLDDPIRLRKYCRVVPRPLDAIIHRAMEKNPAERYPSAALLAEDLRRWLAGEPLLIQPPRRIAQLRRFIARHPATFATLSLLFVIISAVAAWMSVLYADADRMRREAERARAAADSARDSEKAARQSAEIDRNRAEQASRFLREMLASIDPEVAQGRDVSVIRAALDRSAARVEAELAGQPEIAGDVRMTIGQAYRRIGRYSDAEPHLSAALELQRQTRGEGSVEVIEALLELGGLRQDQSRTDEAERLYRDALDAARRTLGDDHLRTVNAESHLASLLYDTKRYDEAERLARRVLAYFDDPARTPDHAAVAAISDLAAIAEARRNLDQARALSERALSAARRSLGDDHPQTIMVLNNAARMLHDQEKLAEAEPLLRQATQAARRVWGDAHPHTLIAIYNLAGLLKDAKRYADAEPLLRECLAGQRKALGENIEDTLHTQSLLGQVLDFGGKPQEAADVFRDLIPRAAETFGEDSDETLLANTNLANVLLASGEGEAALKLFQHVFERGRETRLRGHPYVAIWEGNYGRCLAKLGRYAEAEPHLRDPLETLRRSFGPRHIVVQRALERLVDLYTGWGKADDAAAFQAELDEARASEPLP